MRDQPSEEGLFQIRQGDELVRTLRFLLRWPGCPEIEQNARATWNFIK